MEQPKKVKCKTDCCPACRKQLLRKLIKRRDSDEDLLEYELRIESQNYLLYWANEAPCPRGLLICSWCNTLTGCNKVDDAILCGDCTSFLNVSHDKE